LGAVKYDFRFIVLDPFVVDVATFTVPAVDAGVVVVVTVDVLVVDVPGVRDEGLDLFWGFDGTTPEERATEPPRWEEAMREPLIGVVLVGVILEVSFLSPFNFDSSSAHTSSAPRSIGVVPTLSAALVSAPFLMRQIIMSSRFFQHAQ